jgi:hypothetical protein
LRADRTIEDDDANGAPGKMEKFIPTPEHMKATV